MLSPVLHYDEIRKLDLHGLLKRQKTRLPLGCDALQRKRVHGA
jgi:hypothetical protein